MKANREKKQTAHGVNEGLPVSQGTGPAPRPMEERIIRCEPHPDALKGRGDHSQWRASTGKKKQGHK